MKCQKHPERFTDNKLDVRTLSMIAECPDCLEAFENQVRSEIESGKVPPLPAGFTDDVLDRIGASSREIKRLTFIHYVTAAAAAIIITLSGGFNVAFHSASNYSATVNRYVNEVTAATTKVSVKNIRNSLDDLIQSRLKKKINRHSL